MTVVYYNIMFERHGVVMTGGSDEAPTASQLHRVVGWMGSWVIDVLRLVILVTSSNRIGQKRQYQWPRLSPRYVAPRQVWCNDAMYSNSRASAAAPMGRSNDVMCRWQ